jgi:Zn-dependent protease
MFFNYDPFTIFWLLVSLLIGLSVHEMMHALTGDRLGDSTARLQGRVSLNPLRHIDPFSTLLLPIITLVLFHVPILAAKPVPFNPDQVKYDEFGAAMIAAAGPVSNLVLAVIGGLLAHLASGSAFDALTIFVTVNVGLFVFNLIPIPPLDGSRVLYAVAPEPLQEFMASMEQYGIFIIFALVIFVPQVSEVLINLNSNITRFLL